MIKKIYNPKEICDEKGRIYYFDNLKFILILLVVIGHAIDPICVNSDLAKSTFLFLYLFHMPLFIFVSGYFAKNVVKTKNKNKIILYLLLFLIFQMLIFLVDRSYNNRVTLTTLTAQNAPWYLFSMVIWYIISMKLSKVNRKVVFVFSVILALIVGYDPKIGDFLCLSRTIVYYPFFYLGLIMEGETIQKSICKKTLNTIIRLLFLVIIVIACFVYVDKIYFIRPMLTARNSYYSLPTVYQNFGFFFRFLFYVISILLSITILYFIPKGKTFFSRFGTRTLTVFFLHLIILRLMQRQGIVLEYYQYILLSIAITFILSLKVFSVPFNKLMKIDFKKK